MEQQSIGSARQWNKTRVSSSLGVEYGHDRNFSCDSHSPGVHGEFNSDWEVVLDGAHITGIPIRWRTTRVWKGQSVVAERIHSLP